jgi:hypothetical protein
MTNDPIDLYAVLTFIRHPTVLEFTFKDFKARYKGVKDKDDKAGRRDKKGRTVKNAKKVKGDKNKQTEFDVEWVGTLLNQSMRSWGYKDKLFGHLLTNIPGPKIVDLSISLSLPESVIYSVVEKRLDELMEQKTQEN